MPTVDLAALRRLRQEVFQRMYPLGGVKLCRQCGKTVYLTLRDATARKFGVRCRCGAVVDVVPVGVSYANR